MAHGRADETAHGPPPEVALLQMLSGMWVTQAIYVAAKLGIADLLAAGPKHPRTWAPRRQRTRRRYGACCPR
jgi:hypothetical protein